MLSQGLLNLICIYKSIIINNFAAITQAHLEQVLNTTFKGENIFIYYKDIITQC